MRLAVSRVSVLGMTLLLVVVAFSQFAASGSGMRVSLSGGSEPYEHVVHPAHNPSASVLEVFLNGTAGLTWEPNVLAVPSGAQVVFVVGVIGSLPHNFTLDAISNDTSLSPSWSPSQVDSYFVTNPPLVRIVPTISAGTPVKTATVTMPAYGILTFICEVPGHFQQGMYGHIYVGLPAPASTSATAGLNRLQWDALGIGLAGVVIVSFMFLTRSHKPARPSSAEDDEEDPEKPLSSASAGTKPPSSW